ncbi:MAG: cupin domain-containing protein [Bacteroidales bacterium]|jgi:uncharacterized cupin superfamily protein
MATIFKNDKIEFKEDTNKIDNYRLFTASPRLASVVNSKNLIFDLRLLNPGQFSFPYHFHRNAEELIMVISGSMTMRSPDGFEIMTKGDLVFFEMGETGAHQFFNHSTEPCTYLDIRTLIGIDVCEYPDSGKINVIPYYEVFEKRSKVEYFKGEENISEKWKELKKNKDNES